MRALCVLVVAGLVFTLGCGSCCDDKGTATAPESSPAEVRINEVTFAQLQSAVAAHKGKIVVLDVWGTFCVPCKKEFHNLVEIHRAHEKDGVVCLSLAIGNSDLEEALKFLRAQGAAFPNYLVDEAETRKMANEWEFSGVPAVMVFDRDGKRIPFTIDDPNNQFTYDEVKAKVEQLLKSGGGK